MGDRSLLQEISEAASPHQTKRPIPVVGLTIVQVVNIKYQDQKVRGAEKSNKFEQEAQAVWSTVDIEGKKHLLYLMIANFKYPKKQVAFREKVRTATSCSKLDKLASDIMLYGDGLAVI